MKVTFIYTDYGRYNQNNFNRGVAVLSACLKQAGYRTSLIHISERVGKKRFLKLLRQHQPDIVAFSFISNMFPQVKEFSAWVEEEGITAIHGGMHPTVAPEECLAQKGMDIVVRGEGEGAIVDLCRAIGAGAGARNIPNVWMKEGEQIWRNPPRPLIDDLDSLPYPDYELFNYEKLEEGFVHKIFVTQASRGCNYSCTYCCNPFLRALYNNSMRYLRYHSVDRLLDEVEWGLKKYPFLKEIRFYDDTLTQDKRWFDEFCVKYKERIDLPYSGNERVENIDEETALKLKKSGCAWLDLGIENGDQIIRQQYMNRRMSDEKIIQAFKILRSHGIRTSSFNILGMVGETAQTALATIKLNSLARPDRIYNAYFYPFKGTQAFESVRKRGYKLEDNIGSFFERPVVMLDTIKQTQLVFFYKYFFFLMGIYRLLSPEGKAARSLQALDKILAWEHFPYRIFNFFHYGKDDLLAFLRKYPRIYLGLRRVYRALKKK